MRFHYICRDKHIDLFPKTFAVEKIGIFRIKYFHKIKQILVNMSCLLSDLIYHFLLK